MKKINKRSFFKALFYASPGLLLIMTGFLFDYSEWKLDGSMMNQSYISMILDLAVYIACFIMQLILFYRFCEVMRILETNEDFVIEKARFYKTAHDFFTNDYLEKDDIKYEEEK